MARTSRTRVRVIPFPAGKFSQTYNGVTSTSSNSGQYELKESCMDSVGRPVTENALSIEITDRRKMELLNGSYSQSNGTASATDLVPGVARVSLSHINTGYPSAGSQMTTLLARTNPSRPVHVPLMLLQDLYDLPRMLMNVGKLMKTPKRLLTRKEIANQYLSGLFGWIPLVEDLHQLIDLQSHILRRKAEIHRLYTDTGLKRKLRLGNWTATEAGTYTYDSAALMSVTHRVSKTTETEMWGTVRWKPLVTPGYNPTDIQQLELARRVCQGMTTEATMKGLWDLIPWTWMLGWFVNVSNFAMQYSNTIPAIPSSACVMTRHTTKYDCRVTSISKGFTGGGGSQTLTTKNRYVGSGTLTAHLPFISATRLSILGALFVQRFER